MSSHKGSAVAQGSGAPASTRATDTVELAELGPLLEETGRRTIATPTKVRHPRLESLGTPLSLSTCKTSQLLLAEWDHSTWGHLCLRPHRAVTSVCITCVPPTVSLFTPSC